MRAIWLEVPQEFLDERARLGHDKMDELWDGELHMVPPPSYSHDFVTYDLLYALTPIAVRRGWRAHGPTSGLFEAPKNYRLPDVTLFRPERVTKPGLAGAELVVEVLSPYDESRKKLGFYAQLGIRELWLVEPSSRAIEIYTLAGTSYAPVAATAGVFTSPELGITLEVIAGPKLRLREGDYVVDV